ncbi:unnamed protein product, partial [Rotaria sp. Silwood1]
EIREKIAQCEVEMSIIQSHNNTSHYVYSIKQGKRK